MITNMRGHIRFQTVICLILLLAACEQPIVTEVQDPAIYSVVKSKEYISSYYESEFGPSFTADGIEFDFHQVEVPAKWLITVDGHTFDNRHYYEQFEVGQRVVIMHKIITEKRQSGSDDYHEWWLEPLPEEE